MRLLVLGGTAFVGRAVAEAAVARGIDVTLFNRGLSEPAPAGVSVRHGDRRAEGGLDALADGEWDAVVDTWSAEPFVVRDSARLLAGRAGRYLYVSSRSVYTWPPAEGLDESGPVLESSPDAGENGEPVDYGEAKRGGELAAEAAFGDRAVLVRAGLILGPHENVGRLPFWLRRIAAGGRVPVPGPPELDLQYIDARDLADWILGAAADRLSGVYNLVGPPGLTTTGDLLQAVRAVTGSTAEFCWITPEGVAAAGVEPWTELPAWLPPGPDHAAMHRGDVSKALASGLRCRPTVETVADTWAWMQSLPGEPPARTDRPASGYDAAAEERLLLRYAETAGH